MPRRPSRTPHEVLVDTSALYALLCATDACHEEARTTAEELFARDATLVASSYVVAETSALLQSRLGRHAARGFLLDFVPYLNVAWVDAGLHARGLENWLAQESSQASLVDCVSFALGHELRLETAFAFDRHFAARGFSVLPPLAESVG
ncbi:MAG: type II toxin-antitoxin system VapC family toxin [Thermoleophilia bacterium]